MSVFTAIDMPLLAAFLKNYSVGEPSGFSGIEAGITNSNFFIDTETGRYVLTIVEDETFADVEWFMQLLAYLHQNNIPCARPLQAHSGGYTQTIANKPATVVQCLQGSDKTRVDRNDCYAIGKVLARFHTSCQNYPQSRNDSRGAAWRTATAHKVRTKLNREELALLNKHMEADYTATLARLPTSVIHADLFKDNVLFNGGRISGIIDFYYACTGCMLYDLAITFNDWCRDDSTLIDQQLANALFDGYESIRPLKSSERSSWPDAVHCAALRFWLSRLCDLQFPPDAVITFAHDPKPLQKILSEEVPSLVDISS